MPKIILFNAPANSGKDAAVDYLSETYGVFPCSFKTHLFHVTQAIYDIEVDVWNSWYTREGKEIPRKELKGLSCRQALIHVSEKVIKPSFGKGFWGDYEAMWIKKYLPDGDIVAFSDCGFDEEVMPLIDVFGKENVFIVPIYREGCSFEGDSRDWVDVSVIPRDNCFHLFNNKTLDDFHQNLDVLYNHVVSMK